MPTTQHAPPRALPVAEFENATATELRDTYARVARVQRLCAERIERLADDLDSDSRRPNEQDAEEVDSAFADIEADARQGPMPSCTLVAHFGRLATDAEAALDSDGPAAALRAVADELRLHARPDVEEASIYCAEPADIATTPARVPAWWFAQIARRRCADRLRRSLDDGAHLLDLAHDWTMIAGRCAHLVRDSYAADAGPLTPMRLSNRIDALVTLDAALLVASAVLSDSVMAACRRAADRAAFEWGKYRYSTVLRCVLAFADDVRIAAVDGAPLRHVERSRLGGCSLRRAASWAPCRPGEVALTRTPSRHALPLVVFHAIAEAGADARFEPIYAHTVDGIDSSIADLLTDLLAAIPRKDITDQDPCEIERSATHLADPLCLEPHYRRVAARLPELQAASKANGRNATRRKAKRKPTQADLDHALSILRGSHTPLFVDDLAPDGDLEEGRAIAVALEEQGVAAIWEEWRGVHLVMPVCSAISASTTETGASEEAPNRPENGHGEDFRWVRWHGREYVLTETQAAMVRVLWQDAEAGGRGVGTERLLGATGGSEEGAIRDRFRRLDGWRNLIESVPGKRGFYRLTQK